MMAAGGVARTRPFFNDLPAALTADQMFVEAWRKVVPNIDPPKTPLPFIQTRPTVLSSIPSKHTNNFYLPCSSKLAGKEVNTVIEPVTSRQMAILPGHVGAIAELKPGVLTVHEGKDMA
ncbi:hypothetical protein Nepgr_019033 [Nepenthes gracilis]|uniref:Uncharacterized protein n=1 Tax=Nepenthes gracilis TaxID=150966 RepID=A0AAD3SV52_NEPGR|nr:hypothetical protein Nepgr_019033 [Nepenthes gracilis]